MSIILENITKTYGKQNALDSVSMQINAGEVVGLLGPNGAGKSTLMKIISCFLPPTKGKALVAGFDIFEKPLEIKKRIGYLPESNPLYYNMYVREALSFSANIYPHKFDVKKRIQEMIELTSLELEIKKKIGELSKGYKQRVGLAQALIHNPDILILDEPTSGLDPNQIVGIRNLIKESGKEKTVLLSTHIMQEVEAICDRVIIINKGRIVADKATKNLSETIEAKNLILVEFDKKVDKKDLLSIDKVSDCETLDDNKWRVSSKDSHKVRENIFEFAVKNNLKVLSLSEEKSKLEDIFRELTME